MVLIYDEVFVADWFFRRADEDIEQAIKDARMMMDLFDVIPDLDDHGIEVIETIRKGLVLLERIQQDG